MTYRCARHSAFAFLACAALAVSADPRDMPVEQYELRLFDALFRGAKPGDGPASLLLILSRTDVGWQRACGTARDYNTTVHTARVVRPTRGTAICSSSSR